MQNTDLNVFPYYDDFDKEKNFHKVLFRPSYPVQARELTTLQSILQNQIENFGNSIYKDGSMVIPGQIGYDLELVSIQVNNTFSGTNVETYREKIKGLTIKGATSKVEASVIETMAHDDPENFTGNTLIFVKYTKQNNTSNQSIFNNNENIIVVGDIVLENTTIVSGSSILKTISQNSQNKASIAYINNGVYYVRGFFVDVFYQSIVLDIVNNKPSYKIGLEVIEDIITADDDESLYDNSIGSRNYGSPSANRLKISTTLVKKAIDDEINSNFIELLRLDNGIIQSFVNRSVYSEIEKELARRTFDSNGNFFVQPFDINFTEELNNGVNNGAFEIDQKTEEGVIPLEDNYTLKISSGSAYVNGFNIETIKPTLISVDKPRDFNSLENQISPNSLGNFVEIGTGVTTFVGMFDLSSGFAKVNLHNQYSNSVTSGLGNTVGYATVVDVKYNQSNVSTNSNVYKIYLSDIELIGGAGTTYKFSDVKSIIQPTLGYVNTSEVLNDVYTMSGRHTIGAIGSGSTGIISGFVSNYLSELRVGDVLFAGTGTSGLFQSFSVQSISSPASAIVTNTSTTSTLAGTYSVIRRRPRLENVNNSLLISPLNVDYAKTIKVNSLPIRKFVSNISISTDVITLNISAGETFYSTNPNDYVGVDSSNGDLIITNVSLNPSFTVATLTTSGNSGFAKLYYPVIKSNPTPRVKTAVKMASLVVDKTINSSGLGLTQNLAFTGNRIEDSTISLGISDVYSVDAIYESSTDNDPIIPNFTLTNVNFSKGEFIKGESSGALGKLIEISSNIAYFVYVSSTKFSNGESILGLSSGLTDIISSVVNGDINIKDNYIFDNGQKNQYYDYAKLIKQPNSPIPQRRLKVIFSYFSSSASGSFYSVNSYSEVSYTDIPTYLNRRLSDMIDYRYKLNNNVSGTGTVSLPFSVESSTLDFNSRYTQGINQFNILESSQTNNFDVQYYQGRIDKLYLTKDGNFKLIKGQSADNPSEPSGIDNSMLLAKITHSPYGFNVSDISITKYKGKRYTMKDIGELENRLNNVEYYTQLNLLEVNTENLLITDSNGLNRFKNGFLVDNFSDHSKGDITNPDYQCSIDSKNGILRPPHYTSNIPLEYKESLSSGVQRTGDLLTLAYNSIISIQQNSCSRTENVNPFNVFAWIGTTELIPATDSWIDTVTVSQNTTNVEGDFTSTRIALNADQNGYAPTQWNSWRVTWTGTIGAYTDTFQINNQRFARDIITTQTNSTRNGIRTRVVPRQDITEVGEKLLSSESATYIRSRNVTFNTSCLKPNTRFYPFFDKKAVLNFVTPKLIEISMVSGTFSVGETVVGSASGCRLKVAQPNNTLSQNPYNNTSLPTTYTNASVILNHDLDVLSNQISSQYYGCIKNGERLVGQTSGAIANITNVRLVSDINGTLSGSFFIPSPKNNTNPKFNIGSRLFRLTTSTIDSSERSDVDSASESTYTATGIVNNVQKNLISVRNAELVRDSVTENRTVISTSVQNTRFIGWIDPLAQSFLVNSKGGEFLTDVELFFKTKDANIPIRIEIRTMENGSPTKTIIPFSQVTLTPDKINLSDTGSVGTKFTFKSPVYVQENQECALVVLSDSNKYNVWISRLGDTDKITNSIISDQPYAGVLFKSQNASTWTPDQYEDLKFRIYRCDFTSSTGVTSFVNADLGIGNAQILNLRSNPIQMTSISNVININHSNHGMVASGSLVQLSGIISEVNPTNLSVGIGTTVVTSITVDNASNFHNVINNASVSSGNLGYLKIGSEIFSYSGIVSNTISIAGRGINSTPITSHSAGELVECYNLNGIPLTQLNKIHTVTNPTLDSYVIIAASVATSSLNAGGSDVFATQNIPYENLYCNVQTLVLPEMNIISRFRGVSGQSLDSSQVPYVIDTELVPIQLNANNSLTSPKLIASNINQINNLGNVKSLLVELSLTNSNKSNLSPVIDLQRTDAITTSNRIRGSVNTDSLLSINDKSKASYITKLVKLERNATSLKVMFDAFVPTLGKIDVYYKAITTNYDVNIDTIPYVKFDYSFSKIPDANNTYIFKEQEHNVENLDFGAFLIKIVMRSFNQAAVPQIKNLRVIALT
jgi:hypothetical protein